MWVPVLLILLPLENVSLQIPEESFLVSLIIL
jgi:hypothetical protein